MKERSVGVTLFAVFFIVGGLLGLVATLMAPGLIQLITDDTRGTMSPEREAQLHAAASVPTQLLSGIRSLASVVAGIGLWKLQRWAWWLTLILTGLAALSVLLRMATVPARGVAELVRLVVVLGWMVLVFWFFMRPAVKAQFERNTNT